MGTSNTFNSLQPDLKESYSDSGKRFKRMKKLMKSRRKSNAGKEASKNPMKFLEENREPSIKGLKGVAF